MDSIIDFLDAYRAIIGAVVVTLLATVIIIKWWDEVKLFWKSVGYGLPLIGKVSRLSKDTARDSSGWFQSEKALCHSFYSDIKKIAADPQMFDRATSYLGKVQERGRNELSLFMWVVIVALVFVEALGFAYVLSGYTLPGASEKMQVQGAFGIAFLISCVLVWLTHSAGSEFHKRGLIKKARIWWQHDQSPERPNLIGARNDVSLENDHFDDGMPSYLQIVHRLDTNARVTPGFPIWSTIAFAAIAFVAIGATVVRYETYKQERVAESTLGSVSTSEGGFSLENLMGNSELPSAITEPQAEADKAAEDESAGSRDTANFTTYAILAVLFVLIQVMGIGIGYRTGFAGRESKKARGIIQDFNSRAEYETWYERKRDAIARIAQKHLSALQSKLAQYAQEMSIDREDRNILHSAADRTFLVHYENQLKEEERLRRTSEAITSERKRTVTPTASAVDAMATNENIRAKAEHPDTRTETPGEMEARLRAELMAEATRAAEPKETEEQMRERLRREMGISDN